MATDIDANLYFKGNESYRNPPVDHAAVVGDWEEATAGETIALMNLVCLQSDGKWDQADADVEAEASSLLGIALTAAANDGDTFIVVLKGRIRDDTWAWTVADDLFVSSTAGGINNSAPGSGSYMRRIGHAVTADIIHFNPDNHYEAVP